MYIGENKVNFTFTPSLEQRTLANIAIMLWNQDDVRDLMSKSTLHILHENWQGIEKAVIEKSFKLQLPQTLNEKLLVFIGRVGLQILSWLDVHHCEYSLVTELPAAFIWTSLGTINNIKTAKLLMMGGTLDAEKSFALACVYCLENEIKLYWSILYFSEHKFKCVMKCVSYWTVYMFQLRKKELSISYFPCSTIPYISLISEAIRHGNETATRYFFNMNNNMQNYTFVKISAEYVALKVCNLNNVVSLKRYSDVMLFLLSIMNAEQQANMIENHTYAFLKCLLVWPWHSLLLEMSREKWNSLSKKEYRVLLCNMAGVMRYDRNHQTIFEEFWHQSPKAYKQFIIEQDNMILPLMILYKIGYEKNVKLILRELCISTKENIFRKSKPIFLYLVSSNKWDSIEFFIQECLSSRDDLITFRYVFIKYVNLLRLKTKLFKNCPKLSIEEYQWDKFFQLVDGCISRYNKKRCIEDNSSAKKHLCKGIEE